MSDEELEIRHKHLDHVVRIWTERMKKAARKGKWERVLHCAAKAKEADVQFFDR